MNGPRVKLTELREYRSERTGNTYFSGYLGKARVVMLRDERAECTGKEIARWNVLLEEPEPREARTGGAQSAGTTPRRSAAPSSSRGGRPGARPAQQSTRDRQERTAADRAAGEFLRERGIEPGSEMSRDELPF